MPYDSFLLDPFLLFITGFCMAWIASKRPPHVRPLIFRLMFVVTMIIYWGTSVSLYFDLEWTRWLWEMCGAATGRDWMLNSGVFHFDYVHPSITTHVVSFLIFTTYPFWLILGWVLGTPQLHRGEELGWPRWRGKKLRQEVWYGTATDAQTGHGLWLHAETVAPPDAPAYAHGWAAFFPVNGAPILSHFGPHPVDTHKHWFATADSQLDGQKWEGQTPRISWQLQQTLRTPPLFVFPRWLWDTELLPGAMTVLDPRAQWAGQVQVDGEVVLFSGNAGMARIFGHGSAERWTWLHADLGDGAVLDIVAAVSTRPGLRNLRPLPFVRLRYREEEWPRAPLLAALTAFRCETTLPKWTLDGQVGARRLQGEVTLPPERCVQVAYRDPDGRRATCTNSERADAIVLLEHKRAGAWHVEGRWALAGTAHAEVGLRE